MAVSEVAIPHGIPKGRKSPSGYINHGCRCDECKGAYRRYMARWLKEHPEFKRNMSRYWHGRRLVTVECTRCSWVGRRDSRVSFESVENRPCPKCGAQVGA